MRELHLDVLATLGLHSAALLLLYWCFTTALLLLYLGMGELHLDVLATRLMRQFQVKAKKGKITISYREGCELNLCTHAN